MPLRSTPLPKIALTRKLMARREPGLAPAWMIVWTSVWVASAGNLALWRELIQMPELNNLRGLGFTVALGLGIAAANALVLALFNSVWTIRPALSLVLLSTAFGAYFMLSYGVVIDPTMIDNVLQTDLRESGDLLGWRLLATVLLLAAPPLAWVWRQPLRPAGALRRLGHNLLLMTASFSLMVGALMGFFQDFSSLMRNHTHVRYLINPLNSLFAVGFVASRPLRQDSAALVPIGLEARPGATLASAPLPPLLLVVVGETARSGNFGLNGYARPTTPQLTKEGVVSLHKVWSCGTSTATSLPCMFSHLGRERFEASRSPHETLVDVLQRAGLAVLWIDNQSGCKGVCDRVPNVSTADLKDPEFCATGECFDEIMLKNLEARIDQMPAQRRAKGVVVFMHQMGSHGPAYYKRVPAAYKTFLPECASNALQQCPQTSVVNAYDNTLIYTDHFLASSIRWLKSQQKKSATALLYVADHGESLGENNLYLHGLPYLIAPDVQKRVPWIYWLSPAYALQRGLSSGCLRQYLDTDLSHDHYFHSVLGLLDVTTPEYQPRLDIYGPCAL